MMNLYFRKLGFFLAAVTLCFSATATARAGQCDASGYRRYDFFVGTWIVTHKDGKPLDTALSRNTG
ncbi:MAG: hypothetical protein ACXWNK_13170 [Vulcanimicrobiaceae bacterium]